jgi:hypothetical protein
VARGKTAELRPQNLVDDGYFALIRELPLRPIGSDTALDRAIAMIDRLQARDALRGDEQA